MSVRIMTKVWEHSQQQEGALLMLLALADHADDGGYCYPSVPAIAKKCRLCERQVYRVIGTLVASGELIKEHQGGGRGVRNGYRIICGEPLNAGINSDNITPETHVKNVRNPDPRDRVNNAKNPDAYVSVIAIMANLNHDIRVRVSETVNPDMGVNKTLTFGTQNPDICDIAYKEETSIEPSRETSIGSDATPNADAFAADDLTLKMDVPAVPKADRPKASVHKKNKQSDTEKPDRQGMKVNDVIALYFDLYRQRYGDSPVALNKSQFAGHIARICKADSPESVADRLREYFSLSSPQSQKYAMKGHAGMFFCAVYDELRLTAAGKILPPPPPYSQNAQQPKRGGYVSFDKAKADFDQSMIDLAQHMQKPGYLS